MTDKGTPAHWSTLQKLIWLHAILGGGGSSGTLVTVTGVSPLTLVNALARPIKSLVQYGKCVQNGTPTPDAPVDILCNNGALKCSMNMANVNADTALVGYYVSAQGVVTADTNNWIYQEYIPVLPNTTYTLSMSSPVYYVTISEYSTAADSGFVVRKTGSSGSNTSLTITTGENTNYIRFGTNVNRAAVTLEQVLAINWMLNLGDTAMDYQPYVEGGIYTDGTPEELTVGGTNLVDLTAVTDDYYYSPSGVYTAVSNARLTDYIPVKAGQKYTVYAKAERSGSAANVRCNLFDSAKEWKSQSYFTVVSGSEAVSTITPTENGYLRVSANYTGTGAVVDWSTFQVVRGEYTLATMPPYEPYVQPQTVTDIPMLLGVGDYKDAVELISGIKTGKVGIKVFDGTEAFTVSSSGAMITAIPDVAIGAQNVPLNTRFALGTSPTSIAVGAQRFGASGDKIYSTNYYMKHPTITTAADFKTWLAALFAAGTPDIMVYPRATETTEQTTAHSLHSYNGTTIVDAQTNVEPVELSVEYMAGAA